MQKVYYHSNGSFKATTSYGNWKIISIGSGDIYQCELKIFILTMSWYYLTSLRFYIIDLKFRLRNIQYFEKSSKVEYGTLDSSVTILHFLCFFFLIDGWNLTHFRQIYLVHQNKALVWTNLVFQTNLHIYLRRLMTFPQLSLCPVLCHGFVVNIWVDDKIYFLYRVKRTYITKF